MDTKKTLQVHGHKEDPPGAWDTKKTLQVHGHKEASPGAEANIRRFAV